MRDQNRPLILLLKLAISCLFIAAGVLFFLEKKDEFLLLEFPSYYAVLAVGAAFIVNIYLSSLFNVIAVRTMGVPFSLKESFMNSSVATAMNFILPLRAGAGFRAVYLKKIYSFPYSHFVSTLAVYYLVTILVATVLGMGCVLYIYLHQGYFRYDLLILFPVVFFVAGGLLLMRRGVSGEDGPASWWSKFLAGYHAMLSEKKVIYASTSIVSVSFLVSTAGWSVALREYAPDIDLSESFLIVTSQIVGGLVTLTPGGMGFQELAGMYVGHRFQITLVELFAVLIWTKFVRIFISLVLALPSFLYLWYRIRGVANN